jgi:hypothetical protein
MFTAFSVYHESATMQEQKGDKAASMAHHSGFSA